MVVFTKIYQYQDVNKIKGFRPFDQLFCPLYSLIKRVLFIFITQSM